MSSPAVMAAVIKDAGKSPKATMRLVATIARQARAVQTLVNVERLALGLSAMAVNIHTEDRRANPIADAIARDPAIADAAILFLDAIAQTP